METIFILYVADQEASKQFYETVLGHAPVLHVPGMTEFQLSEQSKLGLMPETGIAKLICPIVPEPQQGRGIPRAEVYLYVEHPEQSYATALAQGAKAISPVQARNWGDEVAYAADPDGHILAFAKRGASGLGTD